MSMIQTYAQLVDGPADGLCVAVYDEQDRIYFPRPGILPGYNPGMDKALSAFELNAFRIPQIQCDVYVRGGVDKFYWSKTTERR